MLDAVAQVEIHTVGVVAAGPRKVLELVGEALLLGSKLAVGGGGLQRPLPHARSRAVPNIHFSAL